MELSKKTKLETKIIFSLSVTFLLYYIFNLFYTGSTSKHYIFPFNKNYYMPIWYYSFFISIHLVTIIKLNAGLLGLSGTNNQNWKMGIKIGIGLVLGSLIYFLLEGKFSIKILFNTLDFTGWTDSKTGITGFYHPLQEVPKERRLVWFLAFLAFKIIDVLTILLVYLVCKKQKLKAATMVALAFFFLSGLNLIDYWLTNDQFNSIPIKLPVTIAIAVAGILFYLNEEDEPTKVNSENGS